MTDWTQLRRSRTTTAERALERVDDGQLLVVGGSNAEPRTLVAALLARDAGHVSVLMWPGGFPTPLCDPALLGRVTTLLPVPNASTRAALASGQAQHVPGGVHRMLQRIERGEPRIDGALVTVSPPDDEGWCTLGTSVVNLGPAVRAAGYVVAEVNEHMPATRGEGRIHVADIDAFVESTYALPELAPSAGGSRDAQIAARVASIVPDGAAIECGIGALPNAVLAALHGHRDLVIHSGIIGDAVVDLARAGALRPCGDDDSTSAISAGSVLGSRRLYDWVDGNPLVQMRTGLYTHDPVAMSRHRCFVAINAAIEIDLTGQVNAEMIGGELVAGVGGQGDFVRGAQLSPEGINLLVLGATARGGTVSRIVPRLAPGAPVAMTRGDVQWVVTEFGAVNLEGLTLTQRAAALVDLADPEHRPALLDAAAGEPARR